MPSKLDRFLGEFPSANAPKQLVRSVFAIEPSRIVEGLFDEGAPLLVSNRLEQAMQAQAEADLDSLLASEIERTRDELRSQGEEAYGKHVRRITRLTVGNSERRREASGLIFHGVYPSGVGSSMQYIRGWYRDVHAGRVSVDPQKTHAIVATVNNPWGVCISPRFGEYVLPVAVPNLAIAEVIVCTGFHEVDHSTVIESARLFRRQEDGLHSFEIVEPSQLNHAQGKLEWKNGELIQTREELLQCLKAI